MSGLRSTPSRFPELTVYGTPREMGRQIGDAVGELVRGFCDEALSAINKTVSISRDTAARISNESLTYVSQFAPHLVEELQGMAEASVVSIDNLMLLQVRNQFNDAMSQGANGLQGCTALSIGASTMKSGRGVVAQNWDADPALDPYTIVLTRHPDAAPSYMSVTQAGLISYIGMNAAGLAACVNTLPAPSRDVGVPHYFSLRTMFEQTSLAAAVNVLASAHRAIPVNIMMTTPAGPANVEGYIDDVKLLTDESLLVHTNHCLCPDRTSINDEYPELIQSVPRLQRMTKLLSDLVPDCKLTIQQLQSMLSDHENYPQSICRHQNADAQHGFWSTVFSIVMDPTAREMYVSRGNPCEKSFECYDFLDC
ncbi:MAG: peptidase C45 [Planctomycetaceae bacterium]|nr:peptidase C45 [Planctomycetaceae bacterium]MBT6846410.1 peptidase C45 [Planctomycetaceae bacterium]MBT7917041.1 peptidase C45 [Planctomycetaceae bacterium]